MDLAVQPLRLQPHSSYPRGRHPLAGFAGTGGSSSCTRLLLAATPGVGLVSVLEEEHEKKTGPGPGGCRVPWGRGVKRAGCLDSGRNSAALGEGRLYAGVQSSFHLDGSSRTFCRARGGVLSKARDRPKHVAAPNPSQLFSVTDNPALFSGPVERVLIRFLMLQSFWNKGWDPVLPSHPAPHICRG